MSDNKVVHLTPEQYERWEAHQKSQDALHHAREQRRLEVYECEVECMREFRGDSLAMMRENVAALRAIAEQLQRIADKASEPKVMPPW